MGKIRGTHSSPGVYTQITDLQYAAKSLGITTLGLVGETKKGPAFEPIAISDWNMFQDYFGGTSTEKFKGSQMPKYELPYIAKSYLSASDQLYVCRVLGLSGYNAGPAYVLYGTESGSTDEKRYVIGVLRSRGSYTTSGEKADPCNISASTYDTLNYFCDGYDIKIKPYTTLSYGYDCGNSGQRSSNDSGITNEEKVKVDSVNYGKFTIEIENNEKKIVAKYSVSLNPGDKDYIYNVLGSNPIEGNAMLFVESIYDMELKDKAGTKINYLHIDTIKEITINPICDPVRDFLTIPSEKLTKNHLGQTFLCDGTITGTTLDNGTVYKVVKTADGYGYEKVESLSSTTGTTKDAVEVIANDAFYYLNEESKITVIKSLNNYREQFRHAVTPWFISDIKGGDNGLEMKKLFRFHTITDGNAANEQVKITIANIKPDEGLFDVLVRDFNDTDGNQIVLESYKGVNMIPGSPKYIGLKIGTLNGDYELRSKYVMVEVIENEMTETCVPCGFLGYPTNQITPSTNNNVNYIMPSFAYNTEYEEDIKINKQTFGLSDIKGVDVDMLYYKGKDAYTEQYNVGYTNAFHLDSRIEGWLSGTTENTVTIDGEKVSDWTTVSINQVLTNGVKSPMIGSEESMEGTIYEDVKMRKFTCYPYGGFDGWDIYRESRTNTDEFKANKYKGYVGYGYGATFGGIQNGDGLGLSGKTINSDYYAYLAGYNQFNNPEKYVINLFATPGIDYVNQRLLSEEVLDIIHNRKDTFYVMTTPDKPFGAGESVDEMYTATEVVSNLDDTTIDTYYASTYYPWIRYYDKANSMYISLPVTKDVLRNMANVDNKKYPWYAPAGMERGNVDCVRARLYTKKSDGDTVYDGRINEVKTFSVDGVKIWGNKTLYSQDTPMNRINTVRLVLYMRKLITEASMKLIFEPNDTTLKGQWEKILSDILNSIQTDRGITSYKLKVEQTPEMMDAHEMQCALWIKPTPTLEYIEIDFIVTPQGVDFED